ncbi:protein STRUBBELIG-RECEPTOR FAMILY 3 isoform X1 [Morus notabilis]|uniref:protein STRUBBELIG-RECEPTOR FAMILY 3 isoform X1 n=1 Tax=Morus notabilis TaxID=981085 RepID=UPI000CED27F0|nr:protein STRUBBELIG-RECEPTOR FAMILY 3 isoform X1 [Morus notabilis]
MGYLKWDKFFTGLVLIFTLPFCSGITDQLDVMAMNNLYVALGYPPLRGWLLVGGDPCGEFWEGVECVFSNITAIKLSGANLGGELGDGLQFLGSVIQIDFSNNHIGGSVPSALPPTLRNFSLSGNQLTGSIPDALPVLSQLLELSLDNNHLVGAIPDAFQQLTVLTRLDLSGNNLSGQLPSSMGNMFALSTLHLQNNRLVGFLDVLRDLPLQDLNIENNLFSGPIPPKLQTIPNFRKDGNPFNTTIIPTPQAAPSASPARAPSSPEEPLWHRVNGPSSSPIIVKSGEPRRFLNAKAIVWIAITGVSIVATLILCLLFSRWFKAKRRDKIAKEHYFDTYKGSTEKPKHDESSFPRSNQTDTEVAKEAVVRPPERSGVDNQRMGFVPKLKQERVMDVRRNTQSSMYMRDNEIDMTDTDDDVLPPPPPPPPFSTDSDIENSVVPTIVSTAGRPMKSRNLNSVRMFTVASLQQYTSSFSQENFLGEGMLGSVFRAELPYGELLAVKKLDNTVARKQTEEEFLELVSNISKLRHANIVELVGYCADHGQRLLVYEYCRNGTLYDALHVDAEIHQKLSWNRRIQVAIGAARALEYLHEVCRPPVIHRNFRSSNLLLDDKLEVHVSDCGLSPLLASTSVSQQISAGLSVHGYGAPEFESGSYTYQSDVYSFGVVLLELLTRRKPYDRSRPRGEQFLVRWAVPKLHDIDALSRMVDPSLYGAYSMKSLSRLADIISSCLQREPEFRPPISEIVQELLQMT